MDVDGNIHELPKEMEKILNETEWTKMQSKRIIKRKKNQQVIKEEKYLIVLT